MKNLPDNELFDELGRRLRNYSEDPDEDAWDKILALSQRAPEPKWISRTLYASVAASFVAFLLLAYPISIKEEQFLNKDTGHHNTNEKKSNDENVSTIANVPDKKVDSEDERYSHNTNEVDPLVSNTRGFGEMNRPSINDTRIQYAAESSSNEKPTDGIQISNTFLSALPVNYDSTKKSDVTHADSVKVKHRKPIDERNKKEKVRKGFDFYASVTPLFSYQKITPLENDNITVDKFSSSPVMSSDRFGISFEAGVQGKISKHFEYYGGLSYYQQNQTLSYHYKSGEATTVESSSDPLHFTVTPGEGDKQFSYAMKNMGAQLGILYYLKGDVLKHKVGVGLSYHQGLEKKSEGDTYDNSKSNYLFYQLFYRTEFRVNESMYIFFQPNFSQAILSQEELNEPFKLKPYRAGLSLGMLCHI